MVAQHFSVDKMHVAAGFNIISTPHLFSSSSPPAHPYPWAAAAAQRSQKTKPDLLGWGWLFSWWGEGEECSQGLRRAVEASASGAWALGGAPQDLRGAPQVAEDGPQEPEDGPQEEGGGPQEAGGGSQGLVGGPQELVGGPLEPGGERQESGAPPEPGGELQELVGAPLVPGGEHQQMGEDGPLGLEGGLPEQEGGLLGLEGGPLEQGGGPQMLVGEPLVPGGGPQELGDGPQEQGDAPQRLVGGPPVLVGGPQEPVGAAEEGLGALRVQAHWAASVAGAGLLVGAEAATLVVAGEGAGRSSVGVGAVSPQEAQQEGSVGLVASPS